MAGAKMPRGGVDAVQVLKDSGTTQTISVSGSSAATTNAVGSNVVRISTTVAACVTFAASPTATTSDMMIPANGVEYFHVEDGTMKVAAIAQDGASSGTLYVTEMS